MPDQLTYRGDITPTLDYEWMLGPDFGKRALLPRKAVYDPATDTTLVALRGVLPNEFRERVTELVPMQAQREKLFRLFTHG